MPEGHTLHRLAREQTALFAGRLVRVSSPQGRFSAGAALLDGRVLDEVTAYGKHLFACFGADVLHVHLGLYGTFTSGNLVAVPIEAGGGEDASPDAGSQPSRSGPPPDAGTQRSRP